MTGVQTCALPICFFCDPKEQLVVAFGTAAPGELRKYYREQVQDLVYGALSR